MDHITGRQIWHRRLLRKLFLWAFRLKVTFVSTNATNYDWSLTPCQDVHIELEEDHVLRDELCYTLGLLRCQVEPVFPDKALKSLFTVVEVRFVVIASVHKTAVDVLSFRYAFVI